MTVVQMMQSEEGGSPMLDRLDDPAIRERVITAQKWLDEVYTRQGTWPKVRTLLRTKYGEAALSGFLSGSYTGNPVNIANDLEAARELLEGTKSFEPAFVETSMSRRIIRALRQTRSRGELGLLSSDIGVGKSRTFLHLMADERMKESYIYFLANPVSSSKLMSVLGALLSAIGIKPPKGLGPTVCYAALVEYLGNSRKMIIFDESQHFKNEALDTFRTLSEQTKTPMLFSGNKRVFEFGFMRDADSSAFAQFSSRCLVQEHLGTKTITSGDVELIAGQLLDDAVLASTLDELTKATRLQGGFRRLKATLQRCQERANGKPPTPEQVFASIQDVAKLRGGA
jgi:DNA transposition AAA+ family ATPase